MEILFHGDDYGVSVTEARRMLDCHRDGVLSSVSVFPQSPNLSACMALLFKNAPEMTVAVHLNLAEGRCCSSPLEIPLLADARGFLKLDFQRIFLLSLPFFGRRKALKTQIKTELRAQIARIRRFLPYNTPLRLDSHQHIHGIPLVFSALLEIIREDGLSVSALRVPVEPLGPYLRHPSVLLACPPVNFVKTVTLSVMHLFNRRALKRSGISAPVFFGIAMSGSITPARFAKILPAFVSCAHRKGRDLELLFHPGSVDSLSEVPDPDKPVFRDFYLSPCRRLEAETLVSLKPVL